MELPDLPPYAPENQGLATPPEGKVLNKFPFDRKYLQDPFWWDTLGRTLIEQRKILTVPRSDEEQVAMVEQALKDCQALHEEYDVDEDEGDEAGGEDDEENKHRDEKGDEGDDGVKKDDHPESDFDGDGPSKHDEAGSEDEKEGEGKKEGKETYEQEQMRLRIQSIALEAAMKGSTALMRYVVEQHGLRAGESNRGLHLEAYCASRYGHLDVLEILFDQAGVDIDVTDGATTPLYMAAHGGHAEMVKRLLDRGARHDMTTESPRGVLAAAAFSGNVDTFKIVLAAVQEREPDVPAGARLAKNNILSAAAHSGSSEMMKVIVEIAGYGKANDNTGEQRRQAMVAIPTSVRNDGTDETCLDIAIDCALQMNDDGSYIKSDDPYLVEQLKSAAGNCCARLKPDTLRKILQLTSDATTVGSGSEAFKSIINRALHYCYPPRAQPCAQILLEEWGASPNVNNAEEHLDIAYPLLLAQGGVEYRDKDYLRFWLSHGADIHRAWGPFCNGPTALARAIELDEVDLALELLEWGGPVDRIEPGLAGRLEVWIITSDDDLKSVELVAPRYDGYQGKRMKFNFEFEITKKWLQKIELRRSDEELAQDGSGRPVKSRDAVGT